MKPAIASLPAVFSLSFIASAPNVSAAAFTWDGGGGSSSWGTSGNWNPDGAVFNDTTDLTFAGSGFQTYTGVGTAGGTRTVRSMTFNDNFTSSSGRVRFNSGGAASGGNVNHLIFNSSVGNANIILTSGMTSAVDLGSGGASVFGEARLTSNLIITNNSSVGTLTISSPITENSAGRGITKEGVGLVTLTRPSTYTGATTINAGTLRGNLSGDCANSEIILNNTAASFMVGVSATTGEWTCKDFTAAAAGTLQFNYTVAPGTTTSPLLVTNAANFTATPNVRVLVGSIPAAGTYPLMTWGSMTGTAPTTANLTLSPFEFGKSAGLQITGNTLNLTISTVDPYIIKDDNTTDLNLGASWVGGTAPLASQGAKWTNAVTSANTTVLGADATWGGIVIEDPAGPVSIGSGNTLTLGAGGIDLATATADLTLDCGVILGGNHVWNVGAGRTLALHGSVSGAFGITTQGAGTTVLAGSNTWSGTTTVADGVLKLAASNVIPDGSGRGNLSVTGTVDLNGFDDQVNGLSGGGLIDTTATSTASTLTLGGNNQSATFSGIIQNSGSTSSINLVKTGTGTQTLLGANTHSGLTTVNSGALRISNPAALGATTSGTVINGGTPGANVARLELSGGITVSGEAINIKGGGNFLGALTSQSGTNTWAGNVTVGAASTRIGAALSSTLVVSGVIDSGTDPFGLTVRSEGTGLGGTVVFSGANTYLGDTSILIGRLQLDGGDNRLPVGTSVIMGSGTSSAELDLNGTSQEIAGLSVTSGATASNNSVNNSSITSSTLTLNTASASSFAGILKGNLSLSKSGIGTQTLSGANTFAGSITVNGGLLIAAGSTNSPGISVLGDRTNTRTITVNSGGTLRFDSGNVLGANHVATTAPTLVINSGGQVTNASPATNNALHDIQLNSGTLTATTGSASGYAAWNLNGNILSTGSSVISTSDPVNGTVMLKSTGDKTSTFDVTGSLDVSAPLVENSADANIAKLVKTGPGTMTLSAANTYTDTTTVAAGTLALVGGSQASPITVSSGASLGFTLGSPTTSTSSVDLTSGTVKITGTVDNASSYTLITATGGITGTPMMDSPITHYVLQVQDSGTKLVLAYVGSGSAYTTWSGGAAADADTNGDGVENGVAWALGAANPSQDARALLPVIDNTSDPSYLLFSYNRSDLANADPGTSIAVQYGTTLNGWTTAVHDGDNVIIQVTDGSPSDAVVVKLKRSSLAASGRIFARLSVTVTP
ncbi:MAG: autotransporter-associated beta strand repeat-containing protein [Akkermansiaceae bacterium]|jgi:autotransporter-associated beta strand protein|nr:autotransporter-associated beta strand repeat-containing protein [Akkermansiaceae bacterium]